MIASLDELAAALGKSQSLPFRKNAITTVANAYTSLFPVAGFPGPGAAPTTLVGVFPNNQTAGSLKFTDPLGANQTQVGKLSHISSVAGTLVLYDRIWHNKVDPTVTAKQNISFPSGAQRYADGQAVELWAEIYTVLANTTAATWTCDATDQDGNPVTATLAYNTSGAANRMVPFDLPSGSLGVRSVQSFQTNVAQATGAMGLVLMRRIAEIPVAVAGVGVSLDGISLGLPTIAPGACLALMVAHGSSTSSGQIFGRIDLVQG